MKAKFFIVFLCLSIACITKSTPIELPKESQVHLSTGQKCVLFAGTGVCTALAGCVSYSVGEKLGFYSRSQLYSLFVAAFSVMAGYGAYCSMRSYCAEGMVQRVHDICVNAHQTLLILLKETADSTLTDKLLSSKYYTYDRFPLVEAYKDILRMRSLFSDAKSMMFSIKDRYNPALAQERDLYIAWLDQQMPIVEHALCVIALCPEYKKQAAEAVWVSKESRERERYYRQWKLHKSSLRSADQKQEVVSTKQEEHNHNNDTFGETFYVTSK